MSAPPPPPTRGSSLMLGLFLGGLTGFILAAFVIGILGYVVVQKRSLDARKGWNLVPVVVAAEDIPEETVVTFDMISQRSVPEQFVTSSVVKPDSASYIVNQRVLVPLQAGDPLVWSMFEVKKQAAGMVARRDLPAGAVLGEDDVEERAFPEALVTESWVLTRDRPHAVGRKLIAPFRKGDPVLWTHFEAAPGRAQPAGGRGD